MSDPCTMNGPGNQPCTENFPTAVDVTTPEDKDRIDQSEKRGWFEAAVRKALNIPSGYVKVAVLILRWHEDIDDYAAEHTIEIKQLKELFEERLGYSCDEVKLNTTEAKPQHVLNAAIATHIQKYDGPNNLLIVFYTGHGLLQNSEQNLVLSADKPAKHEHDLHRATALWNEAEEPFFRKSTEADVLAILDCCFASYAHKGESKERRMYELLAACEKDRTTPKPGPTSFTSAFITTMVELLDENERGGFTTAKLLMGMNDRTSRPRLWDRLHKDDRRIHLAALDNLSAENKEKRFKERPREKAILKLLFSLEKYTLSKNQLEKLGEFLPIAFENAGVSLRGIEWGKLEEQTGTRRFRKAVKTVSKNVRRESNPGKPKPPEPPVLDSRKRPRSETSAISSTKRRSQSGSTMLAADSYMGFCTPDSMRSRSVNMDEC